MATTEEIKGRRITAVIAAWSVLPALLVIGAAIGGYRVPAAAWVLSVGGQILLAWLLYQGYRWVRLLTIAACGLSVLTAGFRLAVLDVSLALRLLIVVSAGVQALIGWVLWRSPAVREYFDRQDKAASLNISGA